MKGRRREGRGGSPQLPAEQEMAIKFARFLANRPSDGRTRTARPPVSGFCPRWWTLPPSLRSVVAPPRCREMNDRRSGGDVAKTPPDSRTAPPSLPLFLCCCGWDGPWQHDFFLSPQFLLARSLCGSGRMVRPYFCKFLLGVRSRCC